MIEGKMMGRYYTVTGPRVDRYLLVESINEMSAVSVAQVDGLLASLEVA
jgi:replication factor A1